MTEFVSSLVDVLAWAPADRNVRFVAKMQTDIIRQTLAIQARAKSGPDSDLVTAAIDNRNTEGADRLRVALLDPYVRTLVMNPRRLDARIDPVYVLAARLRSDSCPEMTLFRLAEADHNRIRWFDPFAVLPNGLICSFDTEYWKTHRRFTATTYPDESRRTEAQRIHDALSFVNAYCEPAAIVCRVFIKLIHLCRSDAHRSCSSGSFRFRFGDIELVNSDQGSQGDLAEALVHEAIHVFLEAIELVEPFYLPSSRRHRRDSRSPWTGTTVSNAALARECFIWYGLYWFWTKAASPSEHSAINDHRFAHQRQLAACHGFRTRVLCRLVEGAVAPAVVDTIARMQQRVLSSVEKEPSGGRDGVRSN